MQVSLFTLVLNATLILIGILLTTVLLRISGRHEYYYGMNDIQAPLKRWMIILLLIILFMSFVAGVYNLIVPWLFGI